MKRILQKIRSFFQKFWVKRFALFVSIFTVLGGAVFAGVAVFAQQAGGDPTPTPQPSGTVTLDGSESNSTVLTYLLEFLFWFFNIVVRFIVDLLKVTSKLYVTMLQNRQYFSEPFVLIGWATLRDLTNLFFVLILVAIGIMSILRIQKGTIRTLLPRFVAAVLLVNFSFFFCQQILNFADQFTAAFMSVISNIDSLVFHWTKPYQAFDTSEFAKAKNGLQFDMVVASLVLLFFLAIVLGIFLLLILSVIVRYAVLLILIVLSPLAFLAMSFQPTSGYANKFWKAYISFVTWGPVSAFFVWLAMNTMSASAPGVNVVVRGSNEPIVNGLNLSFGNALGAFVSCVFLFMAVYSGKILSKDLSNLTMKFAKKIGGAAGWAADASGAKSFYKGFQKPYQDWRAARKKRLEERGSDFARVMSPTASREDRAAAAKRAFSMSGYKQKTLDKEKRQRVNEHVDNMNRQSQSEVTGQINGLLNQSGQLSSGDKEKLEAGMRVAMKGGFASDLAVSPEQLKARLAEKGLDDKTIGALANVSATSDHADPRVTGYFNAKGATKLDQANAIGQAMRSRQRKVGGLKTLPAEVFEGNESGAYALAALEETRDAQGQIVDIRSELNGETVQNVRDSYTTGGFHRQLNDALVGASLANPNAATYTVAVGGQNIEMTRQQAQSYVRNIGNISR